MVAISTDPAVRWTPPRPRTRPAAPPRRADSSGAATRPHAPLSVVLLAVAAVVVVVAVAVGTAALGRALDTQRGIPASGAEAASVP